MLHVKKNKTKQIERKQAEEFIAQMKHLTVEEKETASHLKANLWLTVAKIVEQETKTLDANKQITASPRFTASLVELVYNQALSIGEDLESFANHAKRKTIQPEDLFMVTRRNDVLTAVLQEYALTLDDSKTPKSEKKKPSKVVKTVKAEPGVEAEEVSKVPDVDADDFDDDDDDFFANV